MTWAFIVGLILSQNILKINRHLAAICRKRRECASLQMVAKWRLIFNMFCDSIKPTINTYMLLLYMLKASSSWASVFCSARHGHPGVNSRTTVSSDLTVIPGCGVTSHQM